MTFGKKEIIVLFICGSILSCLGYGWFVFIPQSKAVSTLKKTYNEKLTLITKANNKDMFVTQINQELKKTLQEISQKRDPVSKPLRVPEILSRLDNEASRLNVKVDKIMFKGNASSVKGVSKDLQQTLLAQLGAEGVQAEPQLNAAQGVAQTGVPQPDAVGGEEQKLFSLGLEFEFSGKYEDIFELLEYYENHKNLYVVKSVEIKNTPTECLGFVSFETYSIQSDKPDFLYHKK